jgi:hypothetical protein
MNFTLLDKSNYLRGLLILIGKDNKLSEEEREMFMKLSTDLGFSSDFCETAMNEILENEFIKVDPPKFSNQEIAKMFLSDGMKLASADKEFHSKELSWLNSVANVNGIEPPMIIATDSFNPKPQYEFEITKHINTKL